TRGAGLRLRPPAALGPLSLPPLLLDALPRCRRGARQKEQRDDRQDRHGDPSDQGGAPVSRRDAHRARPDGAVLRPEAGRDRPHHRGLRRRVSGIDAAPGSRPRPARRPDSLLRWRMGIDLNHGSGFIYRRVGHAISVSDRVNALIDAALVARNRRQTPRNYLGGSRIGEPCARKLVYEVTHTPKDEGRDFDGAILRIFDAGHQFETLSICWLRGAGFDLRTERADGGQFGFEMAGGRLRGHIDGVIVAGPDVGLHW